MATRSVSRSPKAQRRRSTSRSNAAPPRGYSDATTDRLRAYLASVRPRGGTVYLDAEIEQQPRRGRPLVERLAKSSSGADLPDLPLSAGECADILAFMASVEPVDPRTWWSDPSDAPSHVCGFAILLGALEQSMRQLESTAIQAARGALERSIAMTPPEHAQFARTMKRALRNREGSVQS
jgi:hypothetical protein